MSDEGRNVVEHAHEEDGFFNTKSYRNATHLLFALQIFMIILFARCVEWKPLATDGSSVYNYFSGIEIMMFVGFGYLMTFMKTYGLGAVGFTMMITAIGLQWYIFAESFFHQIYHNYNYPTQHSWGYIPIDLYAMMNALFGISGVLISFGAVIGKVKPFQLVIMAIVELVFHAFNYEIVLIGGIQVEDVGGTYADHLFGAYFGLAVSMVICSDAYTAHQRVDPKVGYLADIFSLIGTVFLWIYWPSFVAGGLTPDSEEQQRALINTILSLSASTITTFYLSFWFSKDKKIRPVDIQNATLAGGVAIGCVANLNINPVNAIFVGIAGGAISCIGYHFIQPYLLQKIRLHDTCGVHNLHGMPAIVGAIASVIIAGWKQSADRNHDTELYYGNTFGQWWRQLVGALVTFFVAVIGGLFTGALMRIFDPISPEDEPHKDSNYWEVAEDFIGGAIEAGHHHGGSTTVTTTKVTTTTTYTTTTSTTPKIVVEKKGYDVVQEDGKGDELASIEGA